MLKSFKKLLSKGPQDEEHQKSVAKPHEAADGFVNGDGGASLYRKLEEEARARMSEEGSAGAGASSAPSQALVNVAKTKEAATAVTAHAKKVQAKRLMKELKDIQTSASLQAGVYTVALAEDNLFEWDVKLYQFDKDSGLYKDLQVMSRTQGIDNIWLRFSFPDTYPFAPPFVRVLAPFVQGGYVLGGGAICMELLTPGGWSEAYTVEAVIMQTIATMIKGNARIVTTARKPFTATEAKASYDYLVKTHAKHGWNTPPLGDG